MTIRKDQLTALVRKATALRAPDSTACLDDVVLERAARGRLLEKERHEVVDHLVSCSDCSQAVKVLRELESWAHDTGAIVHQARGPRLVPFTRYPAMRIVALAAVLVMAAGLGALWRTFDGPATAVSRGVRQMGMAVEPVDDSVLNAAPLRLTWALESGDVLYRVMVYDAESTLLWRSAEITGAAVDLSPDLRTRLAVPGRYYWRVVGVSGVVERFGPLMSFEVVRAPATP